MSCQFTEECDILVSHVNNESKLLFSFFFFSGGIMLSSFSALRCRADAARAKRVTPTVRTRRLLDPLGNCGGIPVTMETSKLI